MKKSILFFMHVLGMLFFNNISKAQLQVPFSQRYGATIYGDYLTIGNNMLSTTSTGSYTGSSGNHNVTTVNVDIDADATTFNSSSANLSSPIPAGCITIKKVFLYWSAADYPDPGNEPSWNYNQVKLMLPGQITYTTITADNIIYEGRSTNFNNNPYTCFKDITGLVSSLGSPFGKYQLANVKAKTGSLSTGSGNVGTSAGWQLVIVYEGSTDASGNFTLPPKYISIYDGFANVTSTQNNYNINVSGFQTPAVGAVTGKIMFGALEGDRDLTGDRFQIRNNANVFVDLSTTNRPTDNFFNSRITVEGADFTNRNPASTNTLGFDCGYFTPTTPNIFTNNQTSTAFRLTSTQETYSLYMLGLSIDVKGPNLQPLVNTISPSGALNAGDVVANTLVVENNGDDNAVNVAITRTIPQELDLVLPITSLPAGVTYSYSNASRLLTFFVANGFLDVGDPSISISYQTKVKPQCYFLETACIQNTSSQLTATYNGVVNPALQTILSSSSVSACGIGNLNPFVNNINTPTAAQWATVPGSLNRTVNCNVISELNAVQALFPLSDKCSFPLNKTSGAFVASGPCPTKGTYTNSWTFTDACGRISSVFNQVITVVDVSPPSITNVPSNITVSCASAVPAASISSVTTSDGCGGTVTVSVNDAISNQTCANRYTITRTWTATDVCGNSSTATQTITVNDQTAPSITNVPSNTTVSCASAVPAASISSVTTSDGCGGTVTVTVDDAISNQTCANRYTITRTWTATDVCGNEVTASQTITVNDVTPPTITNVPSNTTVSCASAVPAASISSVTTSDGCGGTVTVSVNDAISNQTCANRYTITRTWTATDVCGNEATATQTITVNDQTIPTFVGTLPQDITVNCNEIPDPVTLTATDNCSSVAVVIFDEDAQVANCPTFNIVRTWTATDSCGNIATHIQTITVQDTSKPSISGVPANITVSCVEEVPAADINSISASDNCGGTITVTVDDAISNQTCANRYTITRTWTATDVCGNEATASQTITVNDVTPPIITNVPSNTTVSCASAVPAATISSVTTSDGCGGIVTVSVDDTTSNQTCANRYTITRTWTATDVCGNSSTASQTIIINDTIAPLIISLLPKDDTVCDILPNPAKIEVVDNCGDVKIDFIETVDSTTYEWIYTRKWVVFDSCVNSIIHIQKITLHRSKHVSLHYDVCFGDSILVNNKYYNVAGTYIDTLSTSNGCDSIVEFVIAIKQKVDVGIKIEGNGFLCENINHILLTSTTIHDEYRWYLNNVIIEDAEDSNLIVSIAGTYILEAINGGCSSFDTIEIGYAQNCPVIDTLRLCITPGIDTTVCVDNLIQLPVQLQNISFCEEPIQTFEVIFNNQNGCINFFTDTNQPQLDTFCILYCDENSLCDTLIVILCSEKKTLPPVAIDDCVEGEKETSIIIKVLANDYDPDQFAIYNKGVIIQPKYGTYDVEENGDVIYTPMQYYCGKDTMYYVVCDNEDGCDTGLICINIDCECIYPEVITPNQDGINDNLIIPCIIGVEDPKLVIWNRWGSIIYEDDNYKNNWQGTYNGADIPIGTYWYSIEYYHPESNEKIIEVRYFMVLK